MSQQTGISPDALLKHAGFVRALAKGLLLDPARADDVVQETLLAALKRPPQDRSRLRAWLGAVGRRIALQQRRSDGRRPKREREAARREKLPSTADVAAQLELQRKVVEAVMELDEPYRSTVVHRYLHDRTPTEIADALGIPKKTVESRLTRALRRLRGRFDREHGGRRKWTVALLPLALPRGHAAAAAAGATATTGGVFAISLKASLAGAAFLLALALGGVWTIASLSEESAPERRPQNSRKAAGVELAPGAARDAEKVMRERDEAAAPILDEPGEPGAREPAALPSGTLAGSVSGRDGHLVGATVRIVGRTQEGRELERKTETGAGGRYRFEGVPPGSYKIHAAAAGYAPYESGHTLLVREQGVRWSIRLETGTTLRVVVRDRAGQPVPGFAARLSGVGDKRTDGDGDIAWEHVADGSYTVTFDLEGKIEGRWLSVPQVKELGLVVGARFGGVLSRPDGTPIAEATVQVTSADGVSARSKTDGTGAYEILALAPGAYDLLARGPGFAADGGNLRYGAGAIVDHPFRLGPQRIPGRLVRGGVGDPKASVYLRRGRWYLQACADEGGRFCFWGVPPGRYELNVQSYYSNRWARDREVVVADDTPVEEVVIAIEDREYGTLDLEILRKDGALVDGSVQFYVQTAKYASTSMAPGPYAPGRFRLRLQTGKRSIQIQKWIDGRNAGLTFEVDVPAGETLHKTVRLSR